MYIKSLLVLSVVLLLLSCSSEGTESSDSTAKSDYESVCTNDPFNGRTQGLYKGVFVDEYALSRCEFDVQISIDTATESNKFCSQRGTLSYTGIQTFVHPTEPRECGSIDRQVSFLWSPSNIIEETGVVTNDDIEFPIRLLIGFVTFVPGRELRFRRVSFGWNCRTVGA